MILCMFVCHCVGRKLPKRWLTKTSTPSTTTAYEVESHRATAADHTEPAANKANMVHCYEQCKLRQKIAIEFKKSTPLPSWHYATFDFRRRNKKWN